MITRREVLVGALACAATAPAAAGDRLYGLIGRMTVSPGRRDEVATLLLAAITDIPGCLSYVVAEDPSDPDAFWITEVWDSERSHDASLSLPQVRAVIARARPMITGFGERHVTAPLGGSGLASPR